MDIDMNYESDSENALSIDQNRHRTSMQNGFERGLKALAAKPEPDYDDEEEEEEEEEEEDDASVCIGISVTVVVMFITAYTVVVWDRITFAATNLSWCLVYIILLIWSCCAGVLLYY